MDLLKLNKIHKDYFKIVPENKVRKLLFDPFIFLGKRSSKRLLPFPPSMEAEILKQANIIKKIIELNPQDVPTAIMNETSFLNSLASKLKYDPVISDDDDDEDVDYDADLNDDDDDVDYDTDSNDDDDDEDAKICLNAGFVADFLTICLEGNKSQILDECLNSPALLISVYESYIEEECEPNAGNISCALFLFGMLYKLITYVNKNCREVAQVVINLFNVIHKVNLFVFSHDYFSQDRIRALLDDTSVMFYTRLEDRRNNQYKTKPNLNRIELVDNVTGFFLMNRLVQQLALLPYFDKIDYFDLAYQLDNLIAETREIDPKLMIDIEMAGYSFDKCWACYRVLDLMILAEVNGLDKLAKVIKQILSSFTDPMDTDEEALSHFNVKLILEYSVKKPIFALTLGIILG